MTQNDSRMDAPSDSAAPAALLAATLALLTLPAPAPSQQPGASGADTPEAAVRGLFDAMRSADSAAARRFLHPDARLQRPVEEDGGQALSVAGVGGWLQSIGDAEPGQLDEEIWELEVRRDGRLATAWMQYAFYLDGDLHHCGVNAFQLVRLEDGWVAFSIADTSREQGCQGPPRGGDRDESADYS